MNDMTCKRNDDWDRDCYTRHGPKAYTKVDNLSCGGCVDTPVPDYGTNGNRWYKAKRSDVSACIKICSSSDLCGGFNFVNSHGKCYFRNNDMTCDRAADTNRDCYIKQATDPCNGKDCSGRGSCSGG